MSDLAQRLHEARDRLGISMEDAERATKIRRRYIEAIEAGDFGRLPDGPPSRGYIKNYARYLGLDPEQSLNDFEAEVGVPITQLSEIVPPPPEHQQAVSVYTRLVKLPPGRKKPNAPADGQADGNGNAPTNGNSVALDSSGDGAGRTLIRHAEKQPLSNSFSLSTPEVTQASDVRPFQTGRSPLSLRGLIGGYNPEAVNKGRKYGSMSMRNTQGNSRVLMVLGMAAAGIVLVVALIGLVLVPALQRGAALATAPTPTQVIKISILGVTPPAADGIPSPNFTPTAGSAGAAGSGLTTTTGSAAATGTPLAAATAQPAPPTVQPTVQPLASGGVQLILDARERAWVRVRVDGAVVYEGIPQIGPNASWRGQNTVGVETGNAGAFDVIINNSRLGPAGARNATVNLSWDATGKPITN
jgi:transcriptional regulator with XRE-family HTH domain